MSGRVSPERARQYTVERQRSGRMLKSMRKYRGLPEPTRPCPAACELCGSPPKKRVLSLDHCHRTGKFRGWLCAPCNSTLGKWGDTPEGLLRVIAYLTREST